MGTEEIAQSGHWEVGKAPGHLRKYMGGRPNEIAPHSTTFAQGERLVTALKFQKVLCETIKRSQTVLCILHLCDIVGVFPCMCALFSPYSSGEPASGSLRCHRHLLRLPGWLGLMVVRVKTPGFLHLRRGRE